MTNRSGSFNPRFKHGLTKGNSYRHPVYVAWQNMKSRCYNRNNAKFARYGGRGITVCHEWLDSKKFADWAFGNGWQHGLTLDRINNDGDYEPENCRWVSQSANSRKKSSTKLTYEQACEIRKRAQQGESQYNLADEFGVSHGNIWFIVNGEHNWQFIADA